MTLTAQHKKWISVGIVIAIVVVIIILAATGGDGEKRSGKKDKNNDQSELLSISDMQPVIDGDYRYSFSGIRWNYSPNQEGSSRVAETKVGFYFNDFTRRSGTTPVSFARPFHVGWYEGDCVLKNEITSDPRITNFGIPVAFSECTNGEITTTLGIFQDMKMIDIYAWTATEEPQLVREIDMTTIVRVPQETTESTLTEDEGTNNAPMLLRRGAAGSSGSI